MQWPCRHRKPCLVVWLGYWRHPWYYLKGLVVFKLMICYHLISRMVWTFLQLSRVPRTSWICSHPPQLWFHFSWRPTWYRGGMEVHNHLQWLTPTGALVELNSSEQSCIVHKKSWNSKAKSLCTCSFSRPTQSSGSMNSPSIPIFRAFEYSVPNGTLGRTRSCPQEGPTISFRQVHPC